MTQRTAITKRSRPRFGLLGEIISELRKVVWLSRREVVYLTVLVLVVAAVVGLILGMFDYGFSRLVDQFLVSG